VRQQGAKWSDDMHKFCSGLYGVNPRITEATRLIMNFPHQNNTLRMGWSSFNYGFKESFKFGAAMVKELCFGMKQGFPQIRCDSDN
jgi:hypothetical protein